MTLLVASNDNRRSPAAYRTSFTGNNEWYTPPRYVDLARQVLGTIDVDPASNDHAQKTVRATTYYTAESNGLDQEWHGKVWMNPPYSRDLIGKFIGKLRTEYGAGRTTEAIVLTHNSTDTAWFDDLYASAAGEAQARGRVRFESPAGVKAAPAMGQAFTYFGHRPDRFAEVFGEIGNCMVPTRRAALAQAAHVKPRKAA